MDTSDHGLSNFFGGLMAVKNGLTGIKNALMKLLFILNCS